MPKRLLRKWSSGIYFHSYNIKLTVVFRQQNLNNGFLKYFRALVEGVFLHHISSLQITNFQLQIGVKVNKALKLGHDGISHAAIDMVRFIVIFLTNYGFLFNILLRIQIL